MEQHQTALHAVPEIIDLQPSPRLIHELLDAGAVQVLQAANEQTATGHRIRKLFTTEQLALLSEHGAPAVVQSVCEHSGISASEVVSEYMVIWAEMTRDSPDDVKYRAPELFGRWLVMVLFQQYLAEVLPNRTRVHEA